MTKKQWKKEYTQRLTIANRRASIHRDIQALKRRGVELVRGARQNPNSFEAQNLEALITGNNAKLRGLNKQLSQL